MATPLPIRIDNRIRIPITEVPAEARRRLKAFFYERVNVGDECWTWKLGCDPDGYGIFSINASRRNADLPPELIRKWRAHRFAWLLDKGRLDPTLLVLHRCDNPPCVRPSHLFLGTAQDNVKDRVQKGRSGHGSTAHLNNKGERNANAKLTPEVVELARVENGNGVSAAALARRHGVSHSTMARALRMDGWL